MTNLAFKPVSLFSLIHGICLDDNTSSHVQQVERLARLLLEYPEQLNRFRLEGGDSLCRLLESRIATHLLCMMGKHFRNFSYAAREMEAATNVNHGYLHDVEDRGGKYSGLIINTCLRFAVRQYGVRDSATGKLIPFAKLFFAAYRLKKHNINRECASFEGKPFELLSLDAKVLDKDGNETEDYQVHVAYAAEWRVRRAASVKLVQLLDRAMLSLQGSKCSKAVRKDILAYITLKSFPFITMVLPETRAALEEVLDKELIRFLQEGTVTARKGQAKVEATVYAAYLGCTYDTARKRLRKASKALAELG